MQMPPGFKFEFGGDAMGPQGWSAVHAIRFFYSSGAMVGDILGGKHVGVALSDCEHVIVMHYTGSVGIHPIKKAGCDAFSRRAISKLEKKLPADGNPGAFYWVGCPANAATMKKAWDRLLAATHAVGHGLE